MSCCETSRIQLRTLRTNDTILHHCGLDHFDRDSVHDESAHALKGKWRTALINSPASVPGTISFAQ